jgi:Uma2 family endonuclease
MLLKRARTTRNSPENGEHLVLHNRTWEEYERFGELLNERRFRLTYDQGDLEIMVLSLEHEGFGRFFGLLVFTLARFFGKKLGTRGSFTHQRKDLEKGLEPDNCFYFANLAAIRGKRRIDLTRDPPPDLAIEVDITRSSLDRLGIYAALRVPELWVFDGETLRVHVLVKGRYRISSHSPTFPEVPIPELVQFLDLGLREDDIAMVQALETWLKHLPRPKNGQQKRK